MSMLAERKRKQKWSLNPRGNEWSKDNSKFGQKLMERMGWKEGKGLGAKEDGATEHVRVAYKNDIKGIGFKESVEWSHQQDNFNDLLKELNNDSSGNDAPTIVKSLEEKSEKSRARVHYKKFTRSKDLSRYSEKDLANILGRKKLKTKDTVTEISTANPSPLQSPQFGINTITSGSMVDYFKNKLPNFISSHKSSKNESESETEVSYGFGFSAPKTNDSDQSATIKKKKRKYDDTYEVNDSPSVKKQKKKNVQPDNDGFVNAGFDPTSRNVVTGNHHFLETINEDDEQSPELLTCSKDEMSETKQSSKKKQNDDATKNENKTKKKKTKNSLRDEENGINNPCFNSNDFVNSHSTSDNVALDINIKGTKQKKKKNPKHLEIDSSSSAKASDSKISNISPDQINTTDSTNTLKEVKAKRKKHLRDDTGCFNNPGFVEPNPVDVTPISYIDNPFEIKKKKKSKKCKEGIENPCFNVDLKSLQLMTNNNCNGVENINEFEVKIKSKEKKCKKGVENLAFTDDKPLQYCDDVQSEKRVKRKKKDKCNEETIDSPIAAKIKRKKSEGLKDVSKVNKKYETGIDNPALESPYVDDNDLILNVTDEPVQTKLPDVKKGNKNVHFNMLENSDDAAQRDKLSNVNKAVKTNSRKHKFRGLDNVAFNLKSSAIEESANDLAKSLENCQAEVENGINESKAIVSYQERMIGQLDNPNGEDEQHPDGLILRLKNASFTKRAPFWENQYDVSVSYPKKSYKHLIAGDIVIGFKNTNLHQLSGYGKPFKNKTRVR